MRVMSCLATEHDLRLVVLAAIVCVCGCWVTLDLLQRARERSGKQRSGWIFLSAVAAGCSTWCTHFIAMLAYHPHAPVAFDPFVTLVSLLISILGCGAGIWLALTYEERGLAPAAGGAIFGAAVALMHYVGMTGYHIEGIVTWDVAHILASVVLSVCLAGLAIDIYLRRHWRYAHEAAIAILVISVVALHFTGMAAMIVIPTSSVGAQDEDVLSAMGVAVAGVGLIVVATAIASRLIDSEANSETIHRLQELAHTDLLTGLPNRLSFNETLTGAIRGAQASGQSIAFLVIDLDRFKEINDLRGHDAGDMTLQIVAGRLRNILLDGEYAARTGGDEFACAKVYRHDTELIDFIFRVEHALHEPLHLDDLETVFGASIGISIYPRDGDAVGRLIANADRAMYRAKSDPLRSVCYYEAAMDEESRNRLSLALDLRNVVANNELTLHYQVQKSIVSGAITGYEALLRWKHPTLGNISPAVFIPLAEETGAIMHIGDWVLRTACAEAATWPEPYRVAVNISPAQLLHVDLAERAHDILMQTGLDASRLELEITETTIIQDKKRTLDQLKRLQTLGITIALDDFGTGYSTLETLRSFPFNKIKLDRSFMSDIETNPQSAAILRAALALGHSLQVPVLAEGVETHGQLHTLRKEGCDEAQGYLFGRPAPMAENRAAEDVSAA